MHGSAHAYAYPLDFTQAKLEIRMSQGKGRGVFACVPFSKNSIIETVPVVLLPDRQWLELEKTNLANYYYNWEEYGAAIALGFGSLYNHSYQPSAVYIKRFSDLMIDYVALRDIAAGEEITINYNGRPDDSKPLWFECNS